MSAQLSDETRWPDLPQEVRDRVFDFVFADRIFIHSAWRTAPAFPVCQVSKQFATQEDAIDAILRSGRIKINSVRDLNAITDTLTSKQKCSMKTFTISQLLLKSIESAPNVLQHVTSALGNFRLDVPNALQIHVSVSKHSSVAKLSRRKPEDPLINIDLADDIENGFVSKVEAESMLLDACVKHLKRYTGIGYLMSHVASHNIELQMEVAVRFIERQTTTILATIKDAELSTKDWCVRVPMPDGHQLSIEQVLSKDCFMRGVKDVKGLLGHTTPRRWAIMITLGSGDLEEYKWVWWYQSSALKPWI